MALILTSKKLSAAQKKPLMDAGFELVEHNAIKIQPINFKMPPDVKNAIFTSQNTVKAIQNSEFRIQNCYCVGQKTKALLEENGLHVAAFAHYGKDLAKIIIESHRNRRFVFFCGNRRREELPSMLTENNIAFSEVRVYETQLNLKHFQQKFDGILFFSPSGVESYVKGQRLQNDKIPAFAGMRAFCIGATTASEAKKYKFKVLMAEVPTIESTIEQARAYFEMY